MKNGLSKGQFPTFKLPAEANGWTRVPGQVPTKEDRQIVKYAMKKPKPFKASMLLDHTEPRLSVDHVLDGLGFDPGKYNEWKKFLQKALAQENEVVMRKDLVSKMREEKLDSGLARALMQRSLMYRKGQLTKSTEVYSPDMIRDMLLMKRKNYELEKAEAKGGNYYRRVAKKSGKGFTYYYDEDKYKRSRNAHVNGEDAANSYIQKTVFSRAGGEKGCAVKELKDLVKRYGSKRVGSSLKDAHTNGKLTFKKGKLYYKEIIQEKENAKGTKSA